MVHQCCSIPCVLYCCAHHLQRVDSSLVHPLCHDADADCAHVKRVAKRLNNVLSAVAKFFSKSTKRWASLKLMAERMAYCHQRRLLKYIMCSP